MGFLWKSEWRKKSLVQELVEREDTVQAAAESASKQQFQDETAEDIRKKAMERLKRPLRKCNSDERGASPKRRKSRCAEPQVDFFARESSG